MHLRVSKGQKVVKADVLEVKRVRAAIDVFDSAIQCGISAAVLAKSSALQVLGHIDYTETEKKKDDVLIQQPLQLSGPAPHEADGEPTLSESVFDGKTDVELAS